MSDTRRTLPVIQPPEAPSEPPIFEKIAILGLGLIGGSLALAARRTWPRALVIGVVDDKAILEQAMVLHAIDVAADDPVVIAEADVVVLAAPVRANIALLGELADHVTGSGRRDRRQQHQAGDRGRGAPSSRSACRSSAAIRSPERRAEASPMRGPICSRAGRGCSRRPTIGTARSSTGCSAS